MRPRFSSNRADCTSEDDRLADPAYLDSGWLSRGCPSMRWPRSRGHRGGFPSYPALTIWVVGITFSMATTTGNHLPPLLCVSVSFTENAFSNERGTPQFA